MQLLRRDTDLCAEAKLAAIGKARRGVHVDRRRIHLALEARTVLGIGRHDRFAVSRAMLIDVRNGIRQGGASSSIAVSKRLQISFNSSNS